MDPTRKPAAAHVATADTIDPKVLRLAEALAAVLAPPEGAQAAIDPGEEVRPLKHWAEAYGVALYTLNEARKDGRLEAFVPRGKKRGFVATRAAVEAFLKGAPAAANRPAAEVGDEYLRLVVGQR